MPWDNLGEEVGQMFGNFSTGNDGRKEKWKGLRRITEESLIKKEKALTQKPKKTKDLKGKLDLK